MVPPLQLPIQQSHRPSLIFLTCHWKSTRLIDNISAASPILHSTPSTLTARDHDSSDRQNICDVTIITDMSAAQPSSPSQTCNTSSSTPDSRLSVDIVHTVFPPDIKVTYHDVYIGNVRGSTTKDNIRKQLMSMGVREIGNIIPFHSKNRSTTAFIADQHIDTNVYNHSVLAQKH